MKALLICCVTLVKIRFFVFGQENQLSCPNSLNGSLDNLCYKGDEPNREIRDLSRGAYNQHRAALALVPCGEDPIKVFTDDNLQKECRSKKNEEVSRPRSVFVIHSENESVRELNKWIREHPKRAQELRQVQGASSFSGSNDIAISTNTQSSAYNDICPSNEGSIFPECYPYGSCRDKPTPYAITSTEKPVDCTWLQWKPWSKCTKTCGGGKRYRYRDSSPSRNSGRECQGQSQQEEVCNSKPCPVHCQWSQWQASGQCSKSCGSGTRLQTRYEKVRANYGGRQCSGPSQRNDPVPCNTKKCPVDCKWNQWQPYGTCSQTCGGGYKKRTRTVLEYQRYGGKPCRSSDGESQTSCNTHDCDTCPNGFLEPPPFECSTTNFPTPPNGRKNGCYCDSSCMAHRFCKNLGQRQWMEKECSPDPNTCTQDCEWSYWKPEGECKADCDGSGRGKQKEFRDMEQEDKNGGKPCKGEKTRYVPCTTNKPNPDCRIPCEWSEWSTSPCTATCNSPRPNSPKATRTKTRTILIHPENGGRKCGSKYSEVVECNHLPTCKDDSLRCYYSNCKGKCTNVEDEGSCQGDPDPEGQGVCKDPVAYPVHTCQMKDPNGRHYGNACRIVRGTNAEAGVAAWYRDCAEGDVGEFGSCERTVEGIPPGHTELYECLCKTDLCNIDVSTIINNVTTIATRTTNGKAGDIEPTKPAKTLTEGAGNYLPTIEHKRRYGYTAFNSRRPQHYATYRTPYHASTFHKYNKRSAREFLSDEEQWFTFGEDGTPIKDSFEEDEERGGKQIPIFPSFPVVLVNPATPPGNIPSSPQYVLLHPSLNIPISNEVVPNIYVIEEDNKPPPEPTYGIVVRTRQDFSCENGTRANKCQRLVRKGVRIVECEISHFSDCDTEWQDCIEEDERFLVKDGFYKKAGLDGDCRIDQDQCDIDPYPGCLTKESSEVAPYSRFGLSRRGRQTGEVGVQSSRVIRSRSGSLRFRSDNIRRYKRRTRRQINVPQYQGCTTIGEC